MAGTQHRFRADSCHPCGRPQLLCFIVNTFHSCVELNGQHYNFSERSSCEYIFAVPWSIWTYTGHRIVCNTVEITATAASSVIMLERQAAGICLLTLLARMEWTMEWQEYLLVGTLEGFLNVFFSSFVPTHVLCLSWACWVRLLCQAKKWE